MEAEKPQNSSFESNLFEIPIDKYETSMESDAAKAKKNEILDLLKNCNKFHSEKEFKEVGYYLYGAIEAGDLDLIKIYLSETISDDSNMFQFKIDKTNRTASLIKVNNGIQEAIIPRTVKHESVEYLITSICGVSPTNRIQTLKFVEDSAVETIYGHAFILSIIEEIQFPKSLKKLKKKWNHGLRNTSCKITISPMNGQFMMIENKYLIGKSDPNNNEFDILFFVNREIEEISIPSNIKIIETNAFEFCRNLRKVDFQTNSNLQIIEENAFANTNIKEISIPASVTKICSYAFKYCDNLTKIEIPTNSNLNTIESNAFQYSKIEEIYFPANLKELGKDWCYSTENLTKITISPMNDQFIMIENKFLLGKSDPNNNEFDTLLFANRNIEEISIPSNIKSIATYAFESCKNLRKVEFQTNSKLQIIGEYTFSRLNIEEISIPASVTKICSNAFFKCKNLTKNEFPTNSNLNTFESNAFAESEIKEINFPANLKELQKKWCCQTRNLTKITIAQMNDQFMMIENKYLLGKSDPNNNEFDILLFVNREIEEISIPSNIKIIATCAFHLCTKLTKVEFQTNSNLQIIEDNAFSETSISKISIPSNVKILATDAFHKCQNLREVDFQTNSNLQIIDDHAFSESNIIKISIPASVTKICRCAFFYCVNLKKVEILIQKLKDFLFL